jgi:hypothetical protein
MPPALYLNESGQDGQKNKGAAEATNVPSYGALPRLT